ncbi:MAG: histone deacetylase family protein, partial [Brevundimonas sp.]|nr:histone deacetylase family protein [Brevundimonas sp.]
MSVALFTHPDMIEHRPGAGHPERPERLRAVLDALDDAGLSRDRRAATEAAIADLERLHPVAYVARLLNASPVDGLNALDADTV